MGRDKLGRPRTRRPGGQSTGVRPPHLLSRRECLQRRYGHAVSLDNYRLSPDHVAELLGQAGLVVQTRVLREPLYAFEKSQQAFLLAHKTL